MTCGDTLWSSAPFIDREEWIWQYQDDVGRSVLTIFKIFAGFFTVVVRKHSSPAIRGILLCWAETIGCNGKGKCRGCPTLSFSKHWSLLTLLMTFLFLLNGRFRWQGYWPAEWYSARTKLVSYLYFPFISNKRQVKRGNCHTLISSGDHLFVGMRPSLDHFEVLDTHREAIREVARHVGSRKEALMCNP